MLRFSPSAALAAALFTAVTAQAQSGPDWTAATQVAVSMKSYAFAPAALSFRAGQPYRLALTNTANGGHSFAAPEFFRAVAVAPEDQGKIRDGEIEVEGGTAVEIRFVPRAAGHYQFKCTHFLHASFGMTGTITVE